MIVGDSAVGKSSLLIRLTDDRFSESGTEPTLGVEFGSRILTVGDQGKRVKVQCRYSLRSSVGRGGIGEHEEKDGNDGAKENRAKG